jgi:TetR/AcrR family transcriptional regulator, transcriptional repressor for nem operon
MHTRTLGQGLQVSAIGYGCMGLSQSYLPVPTRQEVIALYGCPHGSLCSELDKRPGRPDFALAELMRVPIEWAEEQFRALGRRDAHDLALSLISAYEGSALLANTFRDPSVLAREARRLNRWIDAL